MNDSSTEFTFDESMSGPLTLGETDPQAGAARGDGPPFTFHATIRVDDLETFIQEPEHAAQLEGHVSYPPFGEELPIRQGRFNLFKSGDDPETRLMLYHMTFEHQGKLYHLAGTKTIHDDRGPDLWRDTTRLFCLLHEGADEQGPVVGAGVLKLDLTGVLKIVASMHSSRPGLENLRAVLRFGRFFLGTLWDVYAPMSHAPRDPEPESLPSSNREPAHDDHTA